MTPTAQPETVLDEARRLVYGDRGADYGHPLDDYERTAALWNAYLGDKLTAPIAAEEATIMMVLVKVSRQRNRPKRDNLVDAAGYAECTQRIIDERERRSKPPAPPPPPPPANERRRPRLEGSSGWALAE
jgi:hypothetical protein